MIDLKIKLQKNQVYTQAGNTFLKLVLLMPILKEEACFLVIVENDKNISSYLKIAENLETKVTRKLATYRSIFNQEKPFERHKTL